MRQTINGADFRRLVISAAAAIEINKQKLNELNVFPVPDGDTGTNMSMTVIGSDLAPMLCWEVHIGKRFFNAFFYEFCQ